MLSVLFNRVTWHPRTNRIIALIEQTRLAGIVDFQAEM